MRIPLFLLMLTLAVSSSGQTKNPFLSFSFDKVIMYDYEYKGEDPALVGKQGKLLSTVTIKKQIQPDSATINNLNKRMGEKTSYGEVTSMCFEPHLGIVYYLHGKIVRYVLICMGCNALRADIDIPAQHQDKQGYGDNTYYLGDGMSKSFRYFINGLLIKYSFSHQKKKISMTKCGMPITHACCYSS